MTNDYFKEVKGIGWDFLRYGSSSGSSKKWPTPLDYIDNLHMTQKGDFGKYLIRQFCALAGLEVIPYSGTKRPYDWQVNGNRVAVRFAFEAKNETWTFNQIRYPKNYDFLCCLGIYVPPKTEEIHGLCFIFSREEIDEWIQNKLFPYHHPGKATWKWSIPSRVVPDHYLGSGTIDELISRLSK